MSTDDVHRTMDSGRGTIDIQPRALDAAVAKIHCASSPSLYSVGEGNDAHRSIEADCRNPDYARLNIHDGAGTADDAVLSSRSVARNARYASGARGVAAGLRASPSAMQAGRPGSRVRNPEFQKKELYRSPCGIHVIAWHREIAQWQPDLPLLHLNARRGTRNPEPQPRRQ